MTAPRTRREVLSDLILDHGLTIGAEIGVGSGPTSKCLMTRFPLLTWIAVDHWPAGYPLYPAERGVITAEQQAGVRASFMKVLKEFAPRLALKEMCSSAAAGEVPDGMLDLVFIDGDHSYAGCKLDIELWSPKVRPGGWITGHDYSAKFPGVVLAVDELLPHRTLHEDAVWMVRA